jgi:glyoxylase-like metal-dependent hydrolase (beta-lactamase superfamily II)
MKTGDKLILFDAGLGNPKDIVAVVMTHARIDHLGGNN